MSDREQEIAEIATEPVIERQDIVQFALWYKENRRPNASRREVERIAWEFAIYLAAKRRAAHGEGK